MDIEPQSIDLSWLVSRPIAHRGLHDVHDGCVENTSVAFAQAIAGNYAIECDVQLSADGEAMVFHDETLDRLMRQTGEVRDNTAAQLKALAYQNSNDRMQTLGDLLDQVNGRVSLVIELKSHFDGDVRLAMRAVEVLRGYKGAFGVMSFDPDLVAAVAELAPDIVRGITADRTAEADYAFLSVERQMDMRNFLHWNRTRPHFVSYAFSDLPFAPVEKIRASGRPVITWTIRSHAEELLALQNSDQVTFEGYLA
jgi:glycerophosphoryl diester phosphodiesterase